MTEEQWDQAVDEAPSEASREAHPEAASEAVDGAVDEAAEVELTSTGHPAVDEVLRSLDALGEAPVDEHVAVFEQAHEQLRGTLQGAGDE